MAAWSGFTDEEVVRLKQQTKDGDDRSNRHNNSLKKASITNSSRKQRSREKIRTRQPASDKTGGVKTENLKTMESVNESESCRADKTDNKGQTERPSANSQNISISTEEDTPESERVMSNDKIEEIVPVTEKPVSSHDESQNITAVTKTDLQEVTKNDIEIIEEPER